MDKLTSKEVDVLMEALDLWDQEMRKRKKVIASFPAFLEDKIPDAAKNDPLFQDAYNEFMDGMKPVESKEITILLKAKLITMLHEQGVQQLTKEK